jgi:hypothetical protein
MGCNLFFSFLLVSVNTIDYITPILSPVTRSRCISPTLSIAFRACGRIMVLSPSLCIVRVCVSNPGRPIVCSNLRTLRVN